MILRITAALLIALLAHAGAYAIIMLSSPKKADIQIRGGSISISLMPTDEVVSDEAGTVGEEATDSPVEEPTELESETPPEQRPEPQPEPILEPELPVAEPVQDPELVPEPDLPEEPALEEAPTPADSSETASTEVPSLDSSDTTTEAAPSSDAATPAGPATDKGPESQTNEPASSDTASAELGNAAEDNYNGALMRHMRKARKFDTNARRSSKISITIDAHGNVLEVRVLRASGDKTWDRRVVKELKRIAPYPAPPSGETHSWSFDAVPK